VAHVDEVCPFLHLIRSLIAEIINTLTALLPNKRNRAAYLYRSTELFASWLSILFPAHKRALSLPPEPFGDVLEAVSSGALVKPLVRGLIFQTAKMGDVRYNRSRPC